MKLLFLKKSFFLELLKVHFIKHICVPVGDLECINKSLKYSAQLKLEVEENFVILNNQIPFIFKKAISYITKS